MTTLTIPMHLMRAETRKAIIEALEADPHYANHPLAAQVPHTPADVLLDRPKISPEPIDDVTKYKNVINAIIRLYPNKDTLKLFRHLAQKGRGTYLESDLDKYHFPLDIIKEVLDMDSSVLFASVVDPINKRYASIQDGTLESRLLWIVENKTQSLTIPTPARTALTEMDL